MVGLFLPTCTSGFTKVLFFFIQMNWLARYVIFLFLCKPTVKTQSNGYLYPKFIRHPGNYFLRILSNQNDNYNTLVSLILGKSILDYFL
ncbi:hypothetical protein NIES4072_23090 [Nostoc commune NIES-4072]|uniref:Uncharacterized protein n=1 Tax=Nostoc commune NIES-4072 TaxID=2005467 RepID=A0A2R5FSK0_NOSCO|nr:hypothetical protein NIES4070_03720 [Nostoc commune HK-02]GBG18644.1 hypothetical protein NIES4072_23090 [Nostoc commune NIES-4072]